jgi:hypothetical protein
VLKPGTTTAWLKGDLLHWVFNSLSEYNQKIEKFSSISANEYYLLGRRSNIWIMTYRATWAFIKAYFLRLGFLDGLNGFVICVQTAHGTFLKYAKLRELQRLERD